MFHAEQVVDKNILRNCFEYCPETGVLKDLRTGERAGYIHNSRGRLYYRMKVAGVAVMCHRVCYFLKTGEFPQARLDHIDGDGLNNKWNNLREAEHIDNMRNVKLYSVSKTGISGVTWRHKDGRLSCVSRIGDGNGGKVHLYEGKGFFEACCRRKSAELELGYHENHGKTR